MKVTSRFALDTLSLSMTLGECGWITFRASSAILNFRVLVPGFQSLIPTYIKLILNLEIEGG